MFNSIIYFSPHLLSSTSRLLLIRVLFSILAQSATNTVDKSTSQAALKTVFRDLVWVCCDQTTSSKDVVGGGGVSVQRWCICAVIRLLVNLKTSPFVIGLCISYFQPARTLCECEWHPSLILCIPPKIYCIVISWW